MRVLLPTCESRGDLEPMVGLAVWLRALGAAVRVCLRPDCARPVAEVGAVRTNRATVAATPPLDRS